MFLEGGPVTGVAQMGDGAMIRVENKIVRVFT
jgi:hypothetical protein